MTDAPANRRARRTGEQPGAVIHMTTLTQEPCGQPLSSIFDKPRQRLCITLPVDNYPIHTQSPGSLSRTFRGPCVQLYSMTNTLIYKTYMDLSTETVHTNNKL